MDDRVDPRDDALGGYLRGRLDLASLQPRQIDEIGRSFHRFGASCKCLRTRRMDADDHTATEIRFGVEQVEQRTEPTAQLATPAFLACRPSHDHRFEPSDTQLESGQITLVLIGKVVVERLPVKARSVENRAYRGRIVALSPYRLEHSLENLFALGRIHKLELGGVG